MNLNPNNFAGNFTLSVNVSVMTDKGIVDLVITLEAILHNTLVCYIIYIFVKLKYFRPDQSKTHC